MCGAMDLLKLVDRPDTRAWLECAAAAGEIRPLLDRLRLDLISPPAAPFTHNSENPLENCSRRGPRDWNSKNGPTLAAVAEVGQTPCAPIFEIRGQTQRPD